MGDQEDIVINKDSDNNMQEYVYASSSNFLKSVALIQNKRRKENEFCDFVLKSKDNIEIKVHKIILSSASPFFADMFDINLIEATTNSASIPFHSNILENCISYMYTGNITIKAKDLKCVTVLADLFRLENLLNFCEETLSQTINASNCIELWRFSELPRLEILRENCVQYILHSADDPLFLKLTIDEVKYLLDSEKLNCSEEKAFYFLIKWIKENEQVISENGETTFAELIDLIRYSVIKESFIATEILSNELFTENIAFWKKIGSYIQFKWRPVKSPILKFSKDITPRIGTRSQNLVCLFQNSMQNISNYFTFSVTKLGKKERKNFGYTMFGNFLLISGGEQDNTCEFFSPIVNEWYDFPAMKDERCLHSSICLDNKIYVCGGQTSLRNSKSVEVFDLNCGEWYLGPNLIQERSNFGLTMLDGCLYAFGGETNCVERLDPRTQAWQTICNECPITEATRCIVVNGDMYCLNKSQKFIFDTRTNKCGNVTNSPVKLFGNSFDICNISDNTYALGYGECEKEIQCHRLNFEENSSKCIWKKFNTSLDSSNTVQTSSDIKTSHLNETKRKTETILESTSLFGDKSQATFGDKSQATFGGFSQATFGGISQSPFGPSQSVFSEPSTFSTVYSSSAFSQPTVAKNIKVEVNVNATETVQKSKVDDFRENLALVAMYLK